MDQIRIKTVAEEDFDQVIASAGGSRISEEASADYLLNEALIELKLVSEEGFEKTERQTKLAKLFRHAQSNRPVVLIDPKRLNSSDSRAYYRVVEVPIKNACKKASKQLQATAARSNPKPVRVLVILNVGYTLLSSDEFKEVCLKCVRNDTSGIDWVVCGGIYFYSDKFDTYVISPFEDFPIDLRRSFPSRNALGEAWDGFLNRLMTDVIRNPTPFANGRMPVIDLVFELDGIRYIRPAPRMPQSTFWPGGVGPRDNTSGIDTCPPVARTFPSLSEHEWKCFKAAMPSSTRLEATYKDWLKACPDESLETTEPLKPLIFVEVNFKDFARRIQKPKSRWHFVDVANFASEVIHQRAMAIIEAARDTEQTMIVPPDYVHLVVNEVGSDKANDYASISHVCEVPGFERREPIVENAKLFFEYGMAVAAAYAIQRKLSSVLYTKRRRS
jgi:hypothetical protein